MNYKMISAPSAQIEAAGGAHLKKIVVNGQLQDDYGTVQGILLATIAAFVIFITIIGPE